MRRGETERMWRDRDAWERVLAGRRTLAKKQARRWLERNRIRDKNRRGWHEHWTAITSTEIPF